MPSTAVVIAWLAVRILDWGGVPHADNPNPRIKRRMPFQREIAVIVVAGLDRRAEPGARGDHDDARRRHAGVLVRRDAVAAHATRRSRSRRPTITTRDTATTNPPAAFSVMNWWDQGYWIMQTGRRVPVSNPTQSGATARRRS